MKKLVFSVVLGLAMMAIPTATYAGDEPANQFTASLSGADEVPPNLSDASGGVSLQISEDETAIEYSLQIEDIANLLVAHIHLGAFGQNGPVVAFLFGPVMPPQSGDVEVDGTITSADLVGPLKGHPLSELIAKLRSGDAYVNAHTTLHPGGEIRGQIEVDEHIDE